MISPSKGQPPKKSRVLASQLVDLAPAFWLSQSPCKDLRSTVDGPAKSPDGKHPMIFLGIENHPFGGKVLQDFASMHN